MATSARTIHRSYNAQARALLLERHPVSTLAEAIRWDLERAVREATGKDMDEQADIVVWHEDGSTHACVSW